MGRLEGSGGLYSSRGRRGDMVRGCGPVSGRVKTADDELASVGYRLSLAARLPRLIVASADGLG